MHLLSYDYHNYKDYYISTWAEINYTLVNIAIHVWNVISSEDGLSHLYTPTYLKVNDEKS